MKKKITGSILFIILMFTFIKTYIYVMEQSQKQMRPKEDAQKPQMFLELKMELM